MQCNGQGSSSPKIKIIGGFTNTYYVSKGAIRKIFCKKSVFLENLRNQGDNLEKFKKQPFKAKKPE